MRVGLRKTGGSSLVHLHAACLEVSYAKQDVPVPACWNVSLLSSGWVVSSEEEPILHPKKLTLHGR